MKLNECAKQISDKLVKDPVGYGLSKKTIDLDTWYPSGDYLITTSQESDGTQKFKIQKR